MYPFQVSAICVQRGARADRPFYRSLLGRIRVDQEIPHGIANAASRVNNDLHLWRAQRNRRIDIHCTIRRAENSTSSLHSSRYLFAPGTEPPGKHASAFIACRQDRGLESALCGCRAEDGQGCAGVWDDDWVL